jgi:hypothetical protein
LFVSTVSCFRPANVEAVEASRRLFSDAEAAVTAASLQPLQLQSEPWSTRSTSCEVCSMDLATAWLPGVEQQRLQDQQVERALKQVIGGCLSFRFGIGSLVENLPLSRRSGRMSRGRNLLAEKIEP